MPRKPTPPVGRKPKEPENMRSRLRKNGTTRLWWEPSSAARQLGFEVVELDADRMTRSRQRATALNEELARAIATGQRDLRAAPRAGARTIHALIEDYRGSPHWKGRLAEKTRDSYGKLLLQIHKKWGVNRAADFDKASMSAWYRALYDTKGPRSAQALIRMMSILFGHAEELGWRPENSNPCFRLKIVTPRPRNRAGAEAELAALLAGAQALGLRAMGLAIRLALYQGQRQTDIRLATRDAFTLRELPGRPGRHWVWQLIRQKRKTAGAMIVHPDVVPHLRDALAKTGTWARPIGDADILIRDEATGRPYSQDLFIKRWNAVRDWAASEEGGDCPSIATLQFRDLRRTFGVLARAAGASRDDIGDVLGNSAAVNPLLGETYMPASFETASRAVSAVKATKGKTKA